MKNSRNNSSPESMTEAIARLGRQGYSEQFRAEANGKLLALSSKRLLPAGDFLVDEVVRFEGDTNLDDESVIFALCHVPTGLKGTYTIAYSTNMESFDLEIMQELENRKK